MIPFRACQVRCDIVPYSIEIRRTYIDADRAIYRWAVENGASGHVLLDRSRARFRPSDEHGNPTGAMYLDMAEGDVRGAGREQAADFVKVVAGIAKKWDGRGTPPETAHRIFG
jgi:hypothetical protein